MWIIKIKWLIITFAVDAFGWFYVILLLHALSLSSLAKDLQYHDVILPFLFETAAWILSSPVPVSLILNVALYLLI